MCLDWEEGVWRKGDVGASGDVDARIVVASDWAPLWGYEGLVLGDPEGVYGDLLGELRRGDLRIVNLECSLSDGDAAPIVKGGPNLRGDPRAIASLAAVPFHVACLANNHVFDYGPEPLRQTLSLLGEAGIATVGAGLSEEDAVAPLVVKAGEVRVGIVDFCEGEDGTTARGGPGVFGWDVALVIDKVRDLRARADVVLVIVHGGREHVPVPPPYVVTALRRIADAGADAVLAHHPHVPQAVEIRGGVPIAYSLGNFVFAQETDLFYRRAGYLVELELAQKKLAGLRLVPYRIGARGLELMQGELKRWFLDRLRRASEPLREAGKVRAAWEAFIDRLGEKTFKAAIEADRRGLCESPPRAASSGQRRGPDQAASEAAASLRNRFVTPAHRELWIDAMTRIIRGEMGTAPEWAADLVREWFSLTTEEAAGLVAR